MVTDPVALPSQYLIEATKARRVELHAAICGLEKALSAASHDPEWAPRARRRLGRLIDSFRDHCRASEGPNGLYAEVLRSSPRHAFAITKLRGEHDEIHAGLDDLHAAINTPPPGDGEEWVEQVRTEGNVLIGLLTRHRQRGADLLYEAFSQDIGGNE